MVDLPVENCVTKPDLSRAIIMALDKDKQAEATTTIGIGPGNEDFAHTRDEHVPVDELVRASRIYARLIEDLCGGEEAR